jgi:hypothetical protein
MDLSPGDALPALLVAVLIGVTASDGAADPEAVTA